MVQICRENDQRKLSTDLLDRQRIDCFEGLNRVNLACLLRDRWYLSPGRSLLNGQVTSNPKRRKSQGYGICSTHFEEDIVKVAAPYAHAQECSLRCPPPPPPAISNILTWLTTMESYTVEHGSVPTFLEIHVGLPRLRRETPDNGVTMHVLITSQET